MRFPFHPPVGSVPTAVWRLESAPALLTLIARRCGSVDPGEPSMGPRPIDVDVDRSIERAAAGLGLDAEPATARLGEVSSIATPTTPALLLVDVEGRKGLLALVGGTRRTLWALTPSGHRMALRLLEVGSAAARSSADAEAMDRMLSVVVEAAGETLGRSLEADRMAARPLSGLWLLRPGPWVPFHRQLVATGLARASLGVLTAHTMQHVLLLASWWVIGRGIFSGALAWGWWIAWLLLLLSVTPFRALEFRRLAAVAARGGALLKRRLLWGALRLEPDEMRHQGAGQLFGRVVDAEAFENLALSGSHVGGIASVELALAVPVLALGAGGWPAAVLLVVWVLVALGIWLASFPPRRRWTAWRLRMTHDLVERMVGQRTVVAQLPPERWHVEEDATLEEYLGVSRALDRAAFFLDAVPRGWLLLGILSVGPALVDATASPAALAIGLGGALFAYRAFLKLVRGLNDLGEAWVAWRNVQPVFAAAARPVERGVALPSEPADESGIVLEGRALTFQYPSRSAPAVENFDLVLRHGDRMVLSGPSGAGKSTLAALLAGSRRPDSGQVLLEGLDLETVGEGRWRRTVALAPQLHENHVLTETLAFNLLLARGWPPSPEDLAEAQRVCFDLGLESLLQRMPAGLFEIVGEGGWRLSHGEKARVLLARALLQRARALLIDEGLASLDPDTLQTALHCLEQRPEAVLLIAHR